MILNIFTDGGSRGNPGKSAIGIVIKDKAGKILHSFGQTIGIATNNVAEYKAVIAALEWLNKNKTSIETVNFFSDSQLIVNQLNGLWKIKEVNLRQLVIQAHQLEQSLNLQIKFNYIPREKNYLADRLVNLVLDKKFPANNGL